MEKGSGFGLYIARRIVEAHHGGNISVQSAEGEGALFVIKLKKALNLEHRDVLDFKGTPISY
jgi:signal transduction histidine kinase